MNKEPIIVCFDSADQEHTNARVKNHILSNPDTPLVFNNRSVADETMPESLKPLVEAVLDDQVPLVMRVSGDSIRLRHAPGMQADMRKRVMHGLMNMQVAVAAVQVSPYSA